MPDSLLDALDIERRAAGWKRMIHEGQVPQPHLAVIGSNVVGFSHADSSSDDDADPQVGEVTALYLLEEFVGTGVGRRLWEAALNQLRESGHTALSVWVLDSNQRGRKFYERRGMSLDGATKEESFSGSTLTEVRYRSSLHDAAGKRQGAIGVEGQAR
ncbi:GNAT family N-acetyltransferase [Arthrobacter sp. zg-Y1171]|uniref:GNAT family N-acetyltransferase n=1 Tax=Arthrobacter sp. zg-Y1171 TaxID=2964610 RepID=UPI002105FE2C|nr:GNAT family N-acetyltransferase [Arthrobacter sp. zg-Y1171]MCQ1995758.1 GNAT family N-acetyltransferase [Arthrobacter sp. zg-Y1171]UWX83160.1 GNAT family N-acetyltransferase [Arthrobacter sp. zg-Y1171]